MRILGVSIGIPEILISGLLVLPVVTAIRAPIIGGATAFATGLGRLGEGIGELGAGLFGGVEAGAEGVVEAGAGIIETALDVAGTAGDIATGGLDYTRDIMGTIGEDIGTGISDVGEEFAKMQTPQMQSACMASAIDTLTDGVGLQSDEYIRQNRLGETCDRGDTMVTSDMPDYKGQSCNRFFLCKRTEMSGRFPGERP